MINFAYRHIATQKQGEIYPVLIACGYELFGVLKYDQKSHYYGLLNQSEFDAFLRWCGDTFVDADDEPVGVVEFIDDVYEVVEPL